MTRHFTVATALLAALLLCSCGATTASSADPLAVRNLVEHDLLVLQTGLDREDVLLASSISGDRFTMDSNVAARYHDGGWDGTGTQAFRGFLADVFNLQANIATNLQLTDLAISGDLATATVIVDWQSQRTDAVPAGQYAAHDTDYFVFAHTAGVWQLLRWQEIPTPPPPFEL